MLEDSNNTVRATDRIGSQGRTGAGLLHHCVTTNSNDSPDVKRGRLDIARYLLGIRSPCVDLSVLDENGTTILHLAAQYGDVDLISLLMDHRNDPERKSQMSTFDINCRCLNNGYTPLHYAGMKGQVGVCKVLINAGALLNVHAHNTSGKENDKGFTPLELVKHRIQSESDSTTKQLLNEVKGELNTAIDKLDSVRQQREQEKSQKDAKAKAEKLRLQQKEQAERELLERKQKQLKEKQERERLKQEEDQRNTLIIVCATYNIM